MVGSTEPDPSAVRPTAVRTQRWAGWTGGAAAVLALAGCATAVTGGTQGAADCTSQVRLGGVVYSGYGSTERPATRHGEADRAECDDLGADAHGSFFPRHPAQVAVWSFAGHPPEEVLGVRRAGGAFEVFVAESLPDRDRDRVLRRLGDGEPLGEPPVTAPRGGDRPVTPRALAAVVADHIGAPSSARRGTDMEELGEGLVAAVELRYPDPVDPQSDGHLLEVGVGSGFRKQVGDCTALEDQGVDGCAETRDGLVFWESATPEEDPGAVYVLVSKGDTDVALFSSGPPVTGDPRRLDLEISVADMVAIAADPRVDVTTSPEALDAGEKLSSWSRGAM